MRMSGQIENDLKYPRPTFPRDQQAGSGPAAPAAGVTMTSIDLNPGDNLYDYDEVNLIRERIKIETVERDNDAVVDDVNSLCSFHSEESDGIEVFRFDRNSLKLRCEKISPKQVKTERATNPASSPSTSSNAELHLISKTCIKHEQENSSSSSSSSDSSSSDSSSDSSSEGDSSDSSSRSSSSSHSSSGSKSSASGSSSSCSNSSNSGSCRSKRSGSGPTSKTCATSSSSSSSDTDNSEDELSKARSAQKPKVRMKPKTKVQEEVFQKNFASTKPNCDDHTIQISKHGDYEQVFIGRNTKTTSSSLPGSDGAKIKVGSNLAEQNVLNFLPQVRTEDLSRTGRTSHWNDHGGQPKSSRRSSRLTPKASISTKSYEAQIKKKLRALLKKDPKLLTDEDRETLNSFPKLVSEVEMRLHKKEVASERLKESEDPPDLLEKKCAQLASVISRAQYLLIYTGAGISTSAKIPDYRGPNGIWTLLQKGEEVTQSLTDFSQTADPTLTHMAIKELWERGICKHVVSQNVDGLHLRSGIPKVALSEVHGNMFIEACTKCGREFVRLFDVTENTRRHHHKTGRFCYHCGHPLRDTVVLFGEKGSLRWPLNWTGAEYHADKADVILILGSSLKVLRRYPWLWCMSKPAQKRPKLYIVNLQWTPKDQFSRLKINGRCDDVMEKVLSHLKIPIPEYSRERDSIFSVATKLHSLEYSIKSTPELIYPPNMPYPEKNKDLRNYIRFEPNFKVAIPYRRKEDSNFEKHESEETVPEIAKGNDDLKAKKRVLKGNNFSWLGNTVASKQQKKRRLK